MQGVVMHFYFELRGVEVFLEEDLVADAEMVGGVVRAGVAYFFI